MNHKESMYIIDLDTVWTVSPPWDAQSGFGCAASLCFEAMLAQLAASRTELSFTGRRQNVPDVQPELTQ